MGRLQWRILVMCFLIVLLDGWDTAAIGFVAPSIMGEWGLAKAMFGPILSAAMFGLADSLPGLYTLKYFLTNATAASLARVLAVAFRRWTVEHSFRLGKQEAGLMEGILVD